MLNYPMLRAQLGVPRHNNALTALPTGLTDHLVDVWLDDYATRSDGTEQVVCTTAAKFSYLFDVEHARLIAAWGLSEGKFHEKRDSSRMRGSPLGNGPLYHRGHAIPHTLGGPLDINLVPQRGSVNVGPFRVLEIRAVASAGALYFTYWKYSRDTMSQTPVSVEQGLITLDRNIEITEHPN
jgi:hypothetical protein